MADRSISSVTRLSFSPAGAGRLRRDHETFALIIRGAAFPGIKATLDLREETQRTLARENTDTLRCRTWQRAVPGPHSTTTPITHWWIDSGSTAFTQGD